LGQKYKILVRRQQLIASLYLLVYCNS